LEDLYEQGYVDVIGVSNFSEEEMRELVEVRVRLRLRLWV